MGMVQTRVNANPSVGANPDTKITFTVSALNTILRYIHCDYVELPQMKRLHALMCKVNMQMNPPAEQVRITLIKVLLDAYLVDNIENEEVLDIYLSNNCREDAHDLFNSLDLSRNQLNPKECHMISTFIDEKIKFSVLFGHKDMIKDMLDELDENIDFTTSNIAAINKIRDTLASVIGELEIDSDGKSVLSEFDFGDERAIDILTNVVAKKKLPTAILQTGIRMLNDILAGGFKGSMLYVILGGSGRFKSGSLLNLADQIRYNNPQVALEDDGYEKCILFVTLENTIEESIDRLYDMYSDSNRRLKDASMEEIIDNFKASRLVKSGPEDTKKNINIIFKYAGNLEISTAQIHTYINEMYAKGKRPIAIFVDYIKRIDTARPGQYDEKTRISFVTKELKNIATRYNIPMITAMQLNREGNSILDEATRNGKSDTIKGIGSGTVGSAFEVYEDADRVFAINLEYMKSTKALHLSILDLKSREKRPILEGSIAGGDKNLIHHPFELGNNIRLMPDTHLERPLSVFTLEPDNLANVYEFTSPQAIEAGRLAKEKLANLQAKHRAENNGAGLISRLNNIKLDRLNSSNTHITLPADVS